MISRIQPIKRPSSHGKDTPLLGPRVGDYEIRLNRIDTHLLRLQSTSKMKSLHEEVGCENA